MSIGVGLSYEMRHYLVGYSLALVSFSHCHAFDYAFFQSTTGYYFVGSIVDKGGVVVYIVKTQAVVVKKLFYASTLARYGWI